MKNKDVFTDERSRKAVERQKAKAVARQQAQAAVHSELKKRGLK